MDDEVSGFGRGEGHGFWTVPYPMVLWLQGGVRIG